MWSLTFREAFLMLSRKAEREEAEFVSVAGGGGSGCGGGGGGDAVLLGPTADEAVGTDWKAGRESVDAEEDPDDDDDDDDDDLVASGSGGGEDGFVALLDEILLVWEGDLDTSDLRDLSEDATEERRVVDGAGERVEVRTCFRTSMMRGSYAVISDATSKILIHMALPKHNTTLF